MPTYSFGADSPMKFEISDKLAERYNEAAEEFFRAQRRFVQKFGREWDPATEPIKIKWTKQHKQAWRDFAQVFDKTVAEQGPFNVNDIMDDYLVKNVVSAASGVAGKLGVLIGTSAMLGALYGALRRL